MNADMVRLMVSSRAMLQCGIARAPFLQLLRSQSTEDRTFAAGIVRELGCADFMPEIAEAFVFEQDQMVLDAFPDRAVMAEALRTSDVGELTRRLGDQLIDDVGSGAEAALKEQAMLSVREATMAFVERSERLYDIADETPELAVEVSNRSLQAAVAASYLLSEWRREEVQEADLLGADVELIDMQLQAASRLWPLGEARVRPCLQRLCGIVPFHHAVDMNARPTNRSAEDMLDELRSHAADTGSQLNQLIGVEPLGAEARCIRSSIGFSCLSECGCVV